MSSPTGNQVYTQGTGTSSTSGFITIFSDVSPSATSVNYPIGKRWVNTTTQKEYILENLISQNGVVTANWVQISGGSGTGILSVTANSGGAVGPDGSNNIGVVGDGTSINMIGNPGAHTVTANVVLPAQYDVLASNISSISGITPGIAGTVLTSTGTTSFPTFQAAGAGSLSTLTPDSGGVVSPVGGTIIVTGYPMTATSAIKGMKTYNGGTNHIEVANLLAITPYVVGKNANDFAFTVIQTAIDAALSDGPSVGEPLVVLVTPGVYTENLTLKTSVYLIGVNNGITGSVKIVGNAIYNPASAGGSVGDFCADNIEFSCTTGSYALSLQQGSSGVANLTNVQFSGTTTGGVPGLVSLGVNGFTVNLYDCSIIAGTGTPPIGYLGSSPLNVYNSYIQYSNLGTQCTSNSGSVSFYNCEINDSVQGSGVSLNYYDCNVSSGPNLCISGSATPVTAYNTTFTSSSGSGFFFSGVGGNTFNYANVVAPGSAKAINNAAVTRIGQTSLLGNISFDGGVTTLSADGQVWIGASGGNPAPATLTAGTGISITNGANSITIASSGGGSGFTWSTQAASFAAVASNAYVVTANATATLPTGATLGTTIVFVSDIAGGGGDITIQCAAGDKIRISTVLGAATGSAVSNSQGDSLTLTYVASQTTWYASSMIGNWTVH